MSGLELLGILLTTKAPRHEALPLINYLNFYALVPLCLCGFAIFLKIHRINVLFFGIKWVIKGLDFLTAFFY